MTAGLAAENYDVPMSWIALYILENFLNAQLRSFQHLREIGGIKKESAGHVLLSIVSPR